MLSVEADARNVILEESSTSGKMLPTQTISDWTVTVMIAPLSLRQQRLQRQVLFVLIA